MMRKLKAVMAKDDRVETEGLMINEDWPGFFIRGDDALYIASIITGAFMHGRADAQTLRVLKDYADIIFAEVPYKQWVDTTGRNIIQAVAGRSNQVIQLTRMQDGAELGLIPTIVWPDGMVSRELEEDKDVKEGKNDI